MNDPDDLILGIDGGGTKTTAWLARRGETEAGPVLGRGTAGPSNPQVVGFTAAAENLDRAIAAAFDQAGLARLPAAVGCFGMAGVDREEDRRRLRAELDARRFAERSLIVHDGWLVLAAGTPRESGSEPAGSAPPERVPWGVALIAGTGSIAWGRDEAGRTARAGGWGWLFGDEGSGYAIAVAGLRAAARAADGRGRPTVLVECFLERLGTTGRDAATDRANAEVPARRAAEPVPRAGPPASAMPDLVGPVYPRAQDRGWVAALAPVVLDAAERGDAAALEIVEQAAGDLADAVAAVAGRLALSGRGFPLALGGRLLVESGRLRERLLAALADREFAPGPVAVVPEPARGAMLLARESRPPAALG